MDQDHRFDELVEQHLRHLRGEGPDADTTGLAAEQLNEIRQRLRILDALAGSSPKSPALQDDPVARRLGLLDGPDSPGGGGEKLDVDDPVFVSLEELVFRHRGSIRTEPNAIEFFPTRTGSCVTLCRSLAEVVLVVVSDQAEDWPTSEARLVFASHTDLTAIAFTSADATRATVVTPSTIGRHLVPVTGWTSNAHRIDPLGIALGSYFERSIPRWDEVIRLPSSDLLEDLGAEGQEAALGELNRVRQLRPTLAHKRDARDFVQNLDPAVLVGWTSRVRSGELTSDDLAEQISVLCTSGIQ